MEQSNIRTIETKIMGVVKEGETAVPCLLVGVEVSRKTYPDSILLSYNDGDKLMESLGASTPYKMVGKEVTAKYEGSKLVGISKRVIRSFFN